ncbi:anaerobic ribonucleoside-triphosphate reductase activating protein [Lagierella sp.]|uniref:anaerobic ribonucleoside-triphosphate reductase activating protein n=1 Tax=Lagierella sp. TaxID=2849657 RepID=UPI00260B5E61|nr:anaerobic ribonucleoside-triphosphate reductase activating protein [Lagierella sp.]
MHFAQIRNYDVANGPGIRTTIFVTGCTIGCKNCFNPEYQNFQFGDIWDEKVTEQLLGYLENPEVEGLTILGGEPFDSSKDLSKILPIIRKGTTKSIWIYSGHVYEELIKDHYATIILNNCDVLVDGPYVEELKDLKLKFKGSSNQRIIDLNRTRAENRIIELDI